MKKIWYNRRNGKTVSITALFLLLSLFWLVNKISLAAELFPRTPQPFHYVNDYTATLSNNDRSYLEAKLNDYSKETSSQIAVVLVPTTGEYNIADYTFQLGNQWGIGRKQLNNGVLMLIAKQDRKIFIATGEGLEGALPDAFLAQLIRQVITPQFKQGNYAQGINQALDYIIAASKGEYQPNTEKETVTDFIPILFILLFIAIIFFNEVLGKKHYVSPGYQHDPLSQVMRKAGRRSRYTGGGFGGFGGGGGSSGGFGGGSFGGGGAGGSW